MADLEPILRAVHAFTLEGKRVYLGSFNCNDDHLKQIIDGICVSFRGDSTGYLTIHTSVFSLRAFAGFQFTPPLEPEDPS